MTFDSNSLVTFVLGSVLTGSAHTILTQHWTGQRVEADDDEGSHGHVDKVKGPGNDVSSKNSEMQGRVRARHETLNGRLKNWGILNQVFRHDPQCLSHVFRACAMVTQLTIENGEPLFEVEY
jgi:hypothetical protein